MTVTLDGSAGVTTSSGAVYDGIQIGTTVATTSGTSIDFTGIPSWASRITVMFRGVSTSGTSVVQVQVGSGTLQTTGYISTAGASSSTTGFALYGTTATDLRSGALIILSMGSNSWVSTGTMKTTTANTAAIAGDVTTAGPIDRLRITTVNGTDTFDAGSVNIMWE